MRIGVALMRTGVDKVSKKEARDRLVKGLDRKKFDKKSNISIVAVPLESPDERKALVEAREKNCQFVAYTRLTDLVTSERFDPNAFAGAGGTVPTITAKVSFQVRRAIDGAEYAIGSAPGEDSSSMADAAFDAISHLVPEMVADLKKGGNVPHRELDAEALDTATTTANRFEVETIGVDYCKWLPTGIAHADALQGVCNYAISLPQKMPNFICEQATSRYLGDSKTPRDLITALVRYEDGNESYSEIKVNGRPAPEAIAGGPGQWSSGEFGSNLRAVFDVQNQPLFEFAGENVADGAAVWVFRYQIVKQNDPLWRLRSDDEVIAPPYGGELWVEQKTGDVRRFGIVAGKIPPEFPTQSAALETFYDRVAFPDGTGFLLPVGATVATRERGEQPKRNELRFVNCHKFRAKTRMLFDVPVGMADAGSMRDGKAAAAELRRELDENNEIYAILREQALREDSRRLEVEQWQDLNANRFSAYEKLMALEKERQLYAAREAATSKGAKLAAMKEEVPTFKSSVRLVPITVVVRDSRGQAFGNIRKEDFQLLENGKPQMITSFSLEKARAAAGDGKGTPADSQSPSGTPIAAQSNAPADRYLAYVFDDIHASFSDLASARNAASRRMAALRAGDRVAVFTTSGEVGLDFTADREKLQAALKDLKPHPVIPTSNCPPMSYYMADLLVNHDDLSVRLLATADAQQCAFNGIESDNPRMAERVAAAKAFEILNAGNVESLRSLRMLHDIVARTSDMPGDRAIVLVSPGLLVPTIELREDLTNVINSAVQAGVVVNTLDVRGLVNVELDPASSHPSDPVFRLRLDTEAAASQGDLLAEVANSTGGTFFHNSNDLEEGFRRTADAPEYIYVLGFTPQKLDGKFHKLKVTVKQSNGQTTKFTVQARQGYYAIRPKSEH